MEEILDAGKAFDFGLEVGSKPELFAGLALQNQPDSLVICNGYKDAEFIRMALLGNKLGKRVIMVVEKLEELRQIISISKQIGVEPLIGTDMCTPALAKHGSDALRREFLAPAISGDYVGCLGVTEVGSGSDVASIRTQARRDGDDYVLSGGKIWTTSGTQADFCCVLANTSDGAAHRNKSLIIVPMKTPGVTVAKKLRKLGMASSDTAQLFFDDVRVPVRYRIGEEGLGFTYQMEQFQFERLWAALKAGAMAQRAIDITIDYTRQRRAFGRSILDNQWVHFSLAEWQVEVEALRALAWAGVERVVQGEDATRIATMAKLKAGRVLRQTADGCLQFWGAMGYAHESLISRIFRDGRLTSIGGGADEVMLQILSKMMGAMPKAG